MLLNAVPMEVLCWMHKLPCVLNFLCSFLWLASPLMAWISKTLKHQPWLNSWRFNICLMSAPSEQFSPTANSEQKPTGYVRGVNAPVVWITEFYISTFYHTKPTKNFILQCFYNEEPCLSFTRTRTCISLVSELNVYIQMYLVQRVCSWIKKLLSVWYCIPIQIVSK